MKVMKKKKHLSSSSRSSTSFSLNRAFPLSLISKLKCLATKLNSRPHYPKRSTPSKPISHSSPASSSSSSTAGANPSPYLHRANAHRLPSSPVDEVLRRIAARFPPSVDDERLLLRSRTSRPTRPYSLTDLEPRPIRCRRSDFRLAGGCSETPRPLEIPTEIERSGDDRRLRRRNQRRERPIIGSETPRRRSLEDRKLKRPVIEETEGSPYLTTRSTPRLPKPIETTGIDPPRRFMHGPDPARKSIAGKIRCRARVSVYSPRAEMGRSKASAARVRGKNEEKGGRELESFAVLKCSRDPQRDFRESMMEMIAEKGMRRAEELEGLLACYLCLNSDEHHDVIVKVFRQVWLDLTRERFASESELGDNCSPATDSRAR